MDIKHYVQTLDLEYYHCTFFFPLIPALDKALPTLPSASEYIYPPSTNAIEDLEAYQYFTPILRNLLFNQGDTHNPSLKPLREWRLPQQTIKTWSLTLKALPPAPDSYVVPDKTVCFDSIRLYQYFNGLQLLAFTVKPESGQSMIMEDWLHFTRLARQLYPTFAEQIKERKIAPLVFTSAQTTIEDKFDKGALHIPPNNALGLYFSPIIKHLVQAFFSDKALIAQWLEQDIALYDDRMFVSVAYGLPESVFRCIDAPLPENLCNASVDDQENYLKSRREQEALRQQRFKQIQALLAYTDRGCDAWLQGYAYDLSYIENDLKDKKLTLWESIGSVYYYTDMVNAYLGRADQSKADDFFITKIAAKDILTKYDRMLIQALFYQASLRYYDQQITVSTSRLLNRKDKAAKEDAIQAQYSQFIQFTNQYWFADLTQQMQGKAIGRLQQQGLELRPEYERILEELNRTSDFLQAEQELAVAEASKTLTTYGGVFAFLALYYALIPILKDWRAAIGLEGDAYYPLLLWSDWQDKLPSWAQDWLLGLIVLFIIPGVCAMGIYQWLKRR